MAPSEMTEAGVSRENLNRSKAKQTNNVQFGKVNQVIDYDKNGRKISYEDAQLETEGAKRKGKPSSKPFKTGYDAINFGAPKEPASANAVLARPSLVKGSRDSNGEYRNWAHEDQ